MILISAVKLLPLTVKDCAVAEAVPAQVLKALRLPVILMVDELIVSNTLVSQPNKKIKVLTVAPLFAEVIRRVYHNESVNSLFT